MEKRQRALVTPRVSLVSPGVSMAKPGIAPSMRSVAIMRHIIAPTRPDARS